MKILFLCHSLDLGGLETYMLRFAKWLSVTNPEYQLHILCKSGKFGFYESDFRNLGVILHSKVMKYFNLIQYFHFYLFLRSNKYISICDFGGDFGALPITVAYVAKTPVRVVFYRCARNVYKPTKLKEIYQLLVNFLVRRFATKILSNSKVALINYHSSCSPVQNDRFKVIRNGIPVPSAISCNDKESLLRKLNISRGHKIVLNVGSGSWVKNHKCMLEIARLAQNNCDKVYFYFVGSGVEKTHSSLVEKMNLKNTFFLGLRRDVDKLLQIADVFLFPSFSEGQPNAFLEAIIGGVPFVASDIAPIRESLSPEWGDRWLFSPDNPEQGYLVLNEHLKNNFKSDPQFINLVKWCRKEYNQNKCFQIFFDELVPEI